MSISNEGQILVILCGTPLVGSITSKLSCTVSRQKKSHRDFFLYPGSDGEDLTGSKQAEGGRPILQRKKKEKKGEKKKLGGSGEMCTVRHKQVKCTGSKMI